MILYLLQLYRLDVAVISLGAYIGGLVFSGGVQLSDLPVGLCISLISFNYIYSLNSIEDREVDRVNKPQRPLPAGKLPLKTAQRYVSILLVLSIVYPFFVRINLINLALYLMLPVLGWAYSKPPIHFKTKLILAPVSIAIMYTATIAIGLTSQLDSLNSVHIILLCFIFLFAFSVVPLKDIEDVEGDQIYDSRNILNLFGMSRTIGISLLGLLTSIFFVLIASQNLYMTVVLVTLSGTIFLLITAYELLGFPQEHLYRSILILIAILGLLFAIRTLVFGEYL